jgi:hypothetical protein
VAAVPVAEAADSEGSVMDEAERTIQNYRNEVSRLNLRVYELTDALRPFAALSKSVDDYHGVFFGDPAPLSDLGSELDAVTMGQLRAARAVLGEA